MSEYSVDHFIAKFEAIPEDRWIAREFQFANAACALGHCGVHFVGIDKLAWTPEGVELKQLFVTKLRGHSVMSINDNASELFPQPTPKQRVLAALKFIKAMETSDAGKNLNPIESHL